MDPTMTPAPEPTAPAEAAELVTMAKAHLAQKKGVGIEAIRLVSTERHTFGDTSLGCPEPGQVYLQVLTPGWIIVLEHSSATMEYHGGRGRVVTC